MFDWLVYVLAAVVTWAFTAIVDKIFLTKKMSPFSYFLLSVPPKIVIVIWFLLTITLNFNIYFWISFVAGILGVLGYYTYAFAVKHDEISRIAGLMSIYPMFVAVLAAILIGEVFTLQSYIGVGLIIAGVILISYKKLRKFVPLIVIILALATNVFYAVEQTFSKISLDFQNFWQFLGPYTMGNLFTIIPGLAISQFRDSLKEFSKIGKYKVLAIISTYAFWTIGIVSFFYAASIGPITLVSAVSTITPFLVLLFATIYSILWPKVIIEKVDTRTISLKVLAVALLVLGVYLIS